MSDRDTLTALLDRYGAPGLLSLLADICEDRVERADGRDTAALAAGHEVAMRVLRQAARTLKEGARR